MYKVTLFILSEDAIPVSVYIPTETEESAKEEAIKMFPLSEIVRIEKL